MRTIKHFCILFIANVTILTFLPPNKASALYDWWGDNIAYVDGDGEPVASYCRLLTTDSPNFKCIKDHTSNQNNKPPNAEYWTPIWPKDPPVSSEGEGQTGIDWDDFGTIAYNYLPAIVDGEVTAEDSISVAIYASNTNFVMANNKTAAGNPVPHECIKDNYGSEGMPSVDEGKDYWLNHFYDGYTPSVTNALGMEDNDCNTKSNCYNYAFDGYKTGSVSKNKSAGSLFAAELNEIRSDSYDNSLFDTFTGDRCYNIYHVWVVAISTHTCPAIRIRWKNSSSQIFDWKPNPYTNDAPKGYGDLYTGQGTDKYAILRK